LVHQHLGWSPPPFLEAEERGFGRSGVIVFVPMSWVHTGIVPRWAGAIIMVCIGVYGLNLGKTQTLFYMRGSNRLLPIWLGKMFCFTLGIVSIIGGVLVGFSPLNEIPK
jgi:hypothetical protein